jgi:hypothetical protein
MGQCDDVPAPRQLSCLSWSDLPREGVCADSQIAATRLETVPAGRVSLRHGAEWPWTLPGDPVIGANVGGKDYEPFRRWIRVPSVRLAKDSH